MKSWITSIFILVSVGLSAQSLIKVDNLYCTPDSVPYDGAFETFHLNGERAAIYNFVEGKLHHSAFFYDESGVLNMTGFYNSNERDGVWQTWDNRGRMVSRAEYRLGKKIGEWIIRDKASEDSYRLYYGNGELLSARFAENL